MTAFWRTLGLKRTDDVAEIRRAYARRLKETDVDADPAAFIALREALERALAYAYDRQYERAELDAPEAAELADVLARAETPPAFGDVRDVNPPVESVPAASTEPDRFQRLEAMLFDKPGAPIDPDALTAAVREILDHPEMESVDQQMRVGYWLAGALEEAIPRSDPVIPMMVSHFGWDKQGGQWDLPWEIAGVVERARTLRAAERLSDPSHRFHDAWLELNSEEPELGLNRLWKRGEVRELLGEIRKHYPQLEQMVPAHRVQLWEAGTRPMPGAPMGAVARRVIFAIWLIYILGRCISEIASPPVPITSGPRQTLADSGAYTAHYQDVSDDLDPLIHSVSANLDLAGLREENPALYEHLVETWERALDGNAESSVLQDEVSNLLDTAYHRNLRGGSADLQRLFWRLYLDELVWLRDVGPNAGGASCEAYHRDGRVPGFPADLEVRRDELTARVLATPPMHPASAANMRRGFSIPDSVFEEAAGHVGRERSAVARLLADGNVTQRCNTRVELIRAVLSLPPAQAAPALQEMSRNL